MATDFQPERFLRYLGLTADYTPAPDKAPVEFLALHLRQLPEHLALYFSILVSPHHRTHVATIRNRRQRYTLSDAGRQELGWDLAYPRWPALLETRQHRPGREQGEDERQWADREFLDGRKKEVGKLGNLLRDFEEEREAERVRDLYRARASYDAARPTVPEEEEDSDEESELEDGGDETPEQQRITFERLIRERFIYGMLEGFEYDKVDWNDHWDAAAEDDAQDRYFDDEEESDALPISGSGTRGIHDAEMSDASS